MSHGIEKHARGKLPLTTEKFRELIRIAAGLGFQSINYDDLAAWRDGGTALPRRPLMIDFDHPVLSMRYEVADILREFGFKGNLFINTGVLDEMYRHPLPARESRDYMTWEEIGELKQMGWHIGAHTVTHPDLSQLAKIDPDGDLFRREIVQSNDTLQTRLGVAPRDFAFTGTTWSRQAENIVKEHYRFGRLWIINRLYQTDEGTVRYADLAGVAGPDESDGGPPSPARYITRQTPAYRLPSMEIQGLIYEQDAFAAYLQNALSD